MNPASSDARKTTAGATSSGTPSRPQGITRVRLSASFGLFCANSLRYSGVSDGPGHTQLTLIRWRATSRATVLVNAMSPPFAAEYTASPVEPTRPASEAMVTILPYSALIMWRSAARVQASGPGRLTARIRSQNSGVVSTNGIGLSQPAQLTSTWKPFQCAATPSIDESTAVTSVTSSGCATALPPAAWISAAARRADAASISATAP